MNYPAASYGVSPGGIVPFAASGGEFDPERLKLFVQLLILTYEEETDSVYIIKERSKGNRDRAQYDKKVHNFVKSILKHVVPDSNHEELIKAARREPLSLAWTRKMKGNLDEYFRNERSRDQRRAVALKKKLVNKGFQLM